MNTTTKICIDCGGEFARSRADATVRCIDCRKARRGAVAETFDRREHDRMMARAAARRARTDHGRGSDEYREAVAHAIAVGAVRAEDFAAVTA